MKEVIPVIVMTELDAVCQQIENYMQIIGGNRGWSTCRKHY